MRLLLAIALILVARLLLASCINDGAPCSHTTTPCCPGLTESGSRDLTGCICIVGTPTSTTIGQSTTTETTTTVPATTTTTLQSLLRFPDSMLGIGRPADSAYTDPRDGSSSDEYVRYVEAQQLLWVVLPKVLNYYGPEPPDRVAVENLTKFGQNYQMKAGTAYQWFHPQYVFTISRDLMTPVSWGSAYTGSTVIASGTGDPTGQLSQLPNEPLTAAQCAALNAFEAAHHAQVVEAIAGNFDANAMLGPAVGRTLAAFVATARNEAERQLFDLVFTGDISPVVPLGEIQAQSQGIDMDHMAWHDGFHCASGTPPDVNEIQLHANSHNLRHLCRAMDPRPDVFFRHYHTTYYYTRVTCAQMAHEVF